MEHAAPLLPQNLAPFTDEVERYVEARIRQFAEVFARQNPSGVGSDAVDVCATKALQELRSSSSSNERSLVPSTTGRQPQAEMIFTHTCRSTGCGDMDCLLCKHNPERRCTRHVKHKYLVEDRLRAACCAPVFIELRTASGALADIPCSIQLQLLDGQKYDEMAKQMPIQPTLSDAEACLIPSAKGLKWVKGPDVKPGSEDEHKVVLPVEGGRVNLEDVMIMVSSEAILTGYRPNFRLLAVAIGPNGQQVPSVPFCLSDPFVATTRRVKNTVKVEIPLVNDDISKLVHMGRATVDKMQNLVDAGRGMNIQLSLHSELIKVNTVGAFQKLVEACEKDRTLKGKVMQVLKLNHDKWEEAAKHARDAVEPDFRPRVWLHRGKNVGIVFKCRRGAVQLEQPEGLVRLEADGSYNPINITAISDVHNPQTLQMTQQLRLEAAEAWAQARHPGWGICARKEDDHPHGAGMDDLMDNRLGSSGMELGPPGPPHLGPGRAYSHHEHSHSGLTPSGGGWVNPASSPFTLESIGHSSGMTITTSQNGNSKDPRQFTAPPHLNRTPITTSAINPHGQLSAFSQLPPTSAPPPPPHPDNAGPPGPPPGPNRPGGPMLPTGGIPWRDASAPPSPFEAPARPTVPPLFQPNSNAQAAAAGNGGLPGGPKKRRSEDAPEGGEGRDHKMPRASPPTEPLPMLAPIESLPDGTPQLVQLMQSASQPMGDTPGKLAPSSEAPAASSSEQQQQQHHQHQHALQGLQLPMHMPVMVIPAAYMQQGGSEGQQKGGAPMMVLAHPGPMTYLTSAPSSSLGAGNGLEAMSLTDLQMVVGPGGTPSLLSYGGGMASLDLGQLSGLPSMPLGSEADILARIPHSAAMLLPAPAPSGGGGGADRGADRGGDRGAAQ